MQRPLNSAPAVPKKKTNIARDGAGNPIVDNIPVAHGMRSRIAPSHDYLHGSPQAPLDDTPNTPIKGGGKPAPINPGTPSRPGRGQHVEGQAAAVFESARTLGRPTIDDPENGRRFSGARPVTSED